MSDNNRKNPREIKKDHEHHDPLERLTRIFNPYKQSKDQNDQSSLQTDRSVPHPPKTSYHDDNFDLSFLEAELENSLTHDLPFDDQKKQQNLHTSSNELTSNIARTTSFNYPEQNSFLSEGVHSLPISHDEEKILDSLSPLPIQKNQSPQNSATPISRDPFFEESDFSTQSENLFFDEADKRNNKGVTTEPAEQSDHFSQTASQQANIPHIQRNYDDNNNFYDAPVNHPYKVSANQQNWVNEHYTDVSFPSTDTNMSFSSSDIISERQNTARNETTSDIPSSLDSAHIDKQFDSKSFSQRVYTPDYPQFYEEKFSEQKIDAAEILEYRDAQAQYVNNAENISDQNNLNSMSPSSEILSTTQKNSFFSHNYTHRDTPPPNVDTYKFAEEIVEKTGPIMVPEVPYEAPEYDVPTDNLKEEFADVFNVGNIPEEDFPQQQQNEIFNEIFHQTMQNRREGAYTNSQDQNANYFPAGSMGYDSSSCPEDSLYKGKNKIPTHASTTPPLKSFIVSKALTKSVVLLILIAIGFAGYSYFFIPPQKNESTPIIHADNTPFKFKHETTETKNDVTHNLDIYKQTTGENEKQENIQQSLIDNSERPEKLAELNQQESTNFSSSSLDESDVEDAVTEAINHTIPTREVQTVVVNQDGTVVLAPMHHTESKNSDESEETTDQTIVDQLQDTPLVSSHDSDIDNKKIEDHLTNDIDRIIAENTSTSSIKGKVIPLPSYAERNSEPQTHTASSPTSPSQVATQNSESYYVQLASQPTQALARDSLKNMKSRFGFLIGTRPLNIHSALIPGKGIYYRVRIQTQNRNDAISLCENIKNSGGSCFITR
ncbi:SPOR domain-containing protein [Bartonella refiksaydamii]|uniref:SPOR domain-containing protein n=1 Tax=Bartonella refiksaydamii TaxID=2654951 RepID=UPI0012EB9DCA|nr:SPOR domain-containing protein [Bartonella refiksaydamii]